jgi:pyridoxine 5-phosphate synthase
MCRLSVNINKIALLRNSRGSNFPNLLQFAQDCEALGAEGITVHPRPDERHVKFSDLAPLKALVKTEFNIEGNPTADFLERVLAVQPHQCTLVPDAVHALTSDSGWDTLAHRGFLEEVVGQLQAAGIRVSIFVNADPEQVRGAQLVGADRVELYTGPYAKDFELDPQEAIKPYLAAAAAAKEVGIGLNAGHDLNTKNLAYFYQQIPHLLEVSIGHALVVDALYWGLEKTLGAYLGALRLPV